MRSLVVVAGNTFRETIRDKILYNLVFFALLLIGASVLLSTLTIGEQSRIVNDLGSNAYRHALSANDLNSLMAFLPLMQLRHFA